MDKNLPPTDSRITFTQRFDKDHYNFPRKGRKSYKNTRGVYRIKTLEVYPVTTLEVYRIKTLEVYPVTTLEVYRVIALEVYLVKY